MEAEADGSVTSRAAWSIERGPGQTRLHRETQFWKQNKQTLKKTVAKKKTQTPKSNIEQQNLKWCGEVGMLYIERLVTYLRLVLAPKELFLACLY